jgi:hypothetical protein
MKTIKYFLFICLLPLAFTACEIDNYDEPAETLYGIIIDKNTGKGLQADMTCDRGIRLKLMEYSWSENPTPYYFIGKQDGSFNHTKIFKGHYGIVPFGPFVPVEEKEIDINGKVELNWEVEPFLNVEWAGEPVLNSNGSITVQVKITRGTSNPAYQQKVTDIWLMINSSSLYVGEDNRDDRYTAKLGGNDANDALGQVITMTTPGSFSMERDYYIRVGARIDVNIEGARRFNFNEPKVVNVLNK